MLAKNITWKMTLFNTGDAFIVCQALRTVPRKFFFEETYVFAQILETYEGKYMGSVDGVGVSKEYASFSDCAEWLQRKAREVIYGEKQE